jgi:hypothetical protein
MFPATALDRWGSGLRLNVPGDTLSAWIEAQPEYHE